MTHETWIKSSDYDSVMDTVEDLIEQLLDEAMDRTESEHTDNASLYAFSRIISRILVLNNICEKFEISPIHYPSFVEKYRMIKHKLITDLEAEIEASSRSGDTISGYLENRKRVHEIFVWADS